VLNPAITQPAPQSAPPPSQPQAKTTIENSATNPSKSNSTTDTRDKLINQRITNCHPRRALSVQDLRFDYKVVARYHNLAHGLKPGDPDWQDVTNDEDAEDTDDEENSDISNDGERKNTNLVFRCRSVDDATSLSLDELDSDLRYPPPAVRKPHPIKRTTRAITPHQSHHIKKVNNFIPIVFQFFVTVLLNLFFSDVKSREL
jgi:hypothetical protein